MIYHTIYIHMIYPQDFGKYMYLPLFFGCYIMFTTSFLWVPTLLGVFSTWKITMLIIQHGDAENPTDFGVIPRIPSKTPYADVDPRFFTMLMIDQYPYNGDVVDLQYPRQLVCIHIYIPLHSNIHTLVSTNRYPYQDTINKWNIYRINKWSTILEWYVFVDGIVQIRMVLTLVSTNSK